MFKPLQSPPHIDICIKDDELQLDGLDLNPDTVKIIQERAKAKLEVNKEHSCKAIAFSQGLFMKMYESFSSLGNVTCNNIRVYLKLFSVTDANQRRLVRSEMSTSLSLTLGGP